MQLLSILLLLVELADFIESVASSRVGYEIMSAAFLAFGQVLAIFFLHWEHNKGKRVPSLMTLYWLLLTCVDGIRFRTLIMKEEVCDQCLLVCLQG